MMALTITDRAICSPRTTHMAERAGRTWRVTWLPGRELDLGQAQAAMLIAEAARDIDAGCDPGVCDGGFWSRVAWWAAQLGMPGPAAIDQAGVPPGE